jgi:thymidylate synthase ThyX
MSKHATRPKKSRPVPLTAFAPPFAPDTYTLTQRRHLAPFFTNLDQSVYAPLIVSPEVIGALCSRTSRAVDDLRLIFLKEYLIPFLQPKHGRKETLQQWKNKLAYGKALKEFIAFLRQHPIQDIFSNPRARSFYTKWLAQYGDDSIAQMAGMHLVFSSLSQVAIKHLEDQRIGLAPIEKSTRYVDYSTKINGRFRYYTDPTLRRLKLDAEYRRATDTLFTTYITLLPKLTRFFQEKFPEEKASVVEKKAFDTLRGLLPTSTLSQVAFFGNGQAYEYLVSRSARHPLGEIRWAAEQTFTELFKIAPSFLRRLKDKNYQAVVNAYQDYVSGKADRVAPIAARLLKINQEKRSASQVKLLEYDPAGEDKVIAAILYTATSTPLPWEKIFSMVKKMTNVDKRAVLDAYFQGRAARWQKVGRALENVFVRFEIVMNIGSWRDLHRHRMQTQQRQLFSCDLGFDVPLEIIEAGLQSEFNAAIKPLERVHKKIARFDPHLAQYAVTMAHRVRFMQWTNLRQCFWEIELRTTPEGHPDYRAVEQKKFRLLEKVYPLLMQYMRVNLEHYDFARRGQEEKIQTKLRELSQLTIA